jgi:hypothetical protein
MNSITAIRDSEKRPTAITVRARFSSPSSLLRPNTDGIDEDTKGSMTQMMQVYTSIGGVVSGDELVGLFCGVSAQPISRIAHWIVDRRVVRIPWRSQTLLPLFQFDLQGNSLRPGIEKITAELSGVFDDLDVAIWFAQPNTWLDGDIPAHVFSDKLLAVLEAARADRFVAMG